MDYIKILATALLAVVLLKLFDSGRALAKGLRAEYLLNAETKRRGINITHVCFGGPGKMDMHAILQRNGYTCDVTIHTGAEIRTAKDMKATLDDVLEDWPGMEDAA